MDDLWVVLPHLGAGGAQKVGLLAAEHFAEQGMKVRVLSLRPEHPVKHRLPANVRMLDVDLHPDAEDAPLAAGCVGPIPACQRASLQHCSADQAATVRDPFDHASAAACPSDGASLV